MNTRRLIKFVLVDFWIGLIVVGFVCGALVRRAGTILP